MSTETKTKPSEHDAAIEATARLKTRFTADMAAAEGELAAAGEAYQKWLEPQIRYQTAQQTMWNLMHVSQRETDKAEHLVVSTAHPSLQAEINRLARDAAHRLVVPRRRRHGQQRRRVQCLHRKCDIRDCGVAQVST